MPTLQSPLLAQVLLGGIMPFSAVSVQVHFIVTAMWGHRVHTFFGILALAFVLFTLVTAFLSIALTYYQLACEDWAWWWRSLVSGASGAVAMLVYAAWYFFSSTEMSGLLQTTYFFGYMGLCAFAFGLMQAFISHTASLLFVRYLYSHARAE